MRTTKILQLLLISFTCVQSVLARNSIWYFGRKSGILFLVCLIYLTNDGQAQLNASVSWNYTGNSPRLGYSYLNKRVSMEAGIRYHINNPNELDSRGFAYKKRLTAFNTLEHFGLYHNAKYFLNKPVGKKYGVYIVNDLIFNRLGLKDRSYDNLDSIDPAGIPVYREFKYERPAILSIEINFGAGLKVDVSPKVKLNLEAGFGIIYFHDSFYLYVNPDDPQYTIGLDGYPGIDPFTGHFRLGISYLFRNTHKTGI
jgi:hypothetical protein